MENAGRGTYFDVRKMHDFLKDGFDGTVEPQAAVLLTGVMQYIAAEIIEVSINAARENTPSGQHVTISDRDILRGLESDPELKELLDSVHVRETKQKH